jgi:hypothetical protein
MSEFIPGLQLSEAYYREAVQPILAADFPRLPHSAALIGYGSDVLGFDTPISTDHEWGPRLLLFLAEDDFATFAEPVKQALRGQLPPVFRGYSTHFSDTHPIQWREPHADGLINHKVWIQTPRAFIQHTLDFDIGAAGGNGDFAIGVLDWLTFPEQRLLEITRGRVFHDGLGELEPLRARFAYYPDPIWLYLLAAQWSALAQEEAFVGRTGDVGDEVGSRLIAARQARRLMKLAFLMARQYAPYSKWFGSAFASLPGAPELGPILQRALAADDWRTRQEQLAAAYVCVAELHNQLSITAALEPTITDYYDRPYPVIFADRFADAIYEQIEDEEVRALPRNIGAVDQFIDHVDILVEGKLCRRLRALFEFHSGAV